MIFVFSVFGVTLTNIKEHQVGAGPRMVGWSGLEQLKMEVLE